MKGIGLAISTKSFFYNHIKKTTIETFNGSFPIRVPTNRAKLVIVSLGSFQLLTASILVAAMELRITISLSCFNVSN